MYYVMQRDSSASSRFIRFREMDPEDEEPWLAGTAFETPPSVVFSSTNEDRLPFSDFALSDYNVPIFSPKLRDLLTELGVANVQYCPVLLKDGGNHLQRDDYRIANVLDRLDCIDHSASSSERSKSGKLLRLKHFRLLEDRIRSAVPPQGKPLLFRLAEYRRPVIVDESVKSACERSGITGAVFTATTEYS